MTKYFIDHPVFACVLSIIIVFIGALSAYNLPIAQYPQISNPRVRVTTNYVGANAEVVEQSVAQAIEKKVNGVDNMQTVTAEKPQINLNRTVGTTPEIAMSDMSFKGIFSLVQK